MTEVENLIYTFEGVQREILLYFHKLLTSSLNLQAKISYKVPFYYQNSWICYLNPNKDESVDLAFPRGNELSNEQGLLEAKERKQVRSITFSQLNEIPVDDIQQILQEAILLDETVPYASKRKKK